MFVGFEHALSFDVAPTSTTVEILPAIPLAVRRPISTRIGKRLIHPDHKDAVVGIQFSADDSKIVANTNPKNTIQIWDARTGQQLVTIDAPDEVNSQEHFVVSTSDFSKLYTYVATPGIVERVKVDDKYGNKYEYPESRIQVWRTSDGKLLEEIPSVPPGMIAYLRQTPDKKYLISFAMKSGTWFGPSPLAGRILDIAKNQWNDLPESVNAPEFSNDSQLVSFFESSEPEGSYDQSVSLLYFPSFEELTRINLPDGVHLGSGLMFSDSNRYLIADVRTYERKNMWNKWKTSVVCFDIESGKEIGHYRFPYDNDSPLQAKRLVSDKSMFMVTWRENPKRLIALNVPEMTVKWDVEVGDFKIVREPFISPNGKFLAVICAPAFEIKVARRSEHVDWDLVPQPQMKLFDCQSGELLETMDLPVGSSGLVFSHDGKTAAFGAVGSVYFVDFSDLVSE